jgi:hypothetical protein
MKISCVIFDMNHKKKPKHTREITVYKAGMTWRFGGISNCHTSRGIYGHNIFNM